MSLCEITTVVFWQRAKVLKITKNNCEILEGLIDIDHSDDLQTVSEELHMGIKKKGRMCSQKKEHCF